MWHFPPILRFARGAHRSNICVVTTRAAPTTPTTWRARMRNRLGVPLAGLVIACAAVACVYASPAAMILGALSGVVLLLDPTYLAVRRLAAAAESALAALIAVAVRITTAHIDSTTTAASSADLALACVQRTQDAARTARASRDSLRARARVVHASLTPRILPRTGRRRVIAAV